MKNLTRIASILTMACLMGVTLLNCTKNGLAPEPAPANKHSSAKLSAMTAQSIMMSGMDDIAIVITGNERWEFDKTAASIADFGYNDCNPATSGQGNGNGCRSQALSNAMQARCIYWNQPGHPYWVLVDSNVSGGGSTDITFDITIAGESWMTSKAFPNLGKYSFTMRDSNGSSRISNLAYSIDGGTPVAIGEALLEDANGDNGCLLALPYVANAGTFGAGVANLITDQTIGYILNLDDFVPNNVGCGSVTIAHVPSFTLPLGTGSHIVTVYGTLKGNDGMAKSNYSYSTNVHISAQGCE